MKRLILLLLIPLLGGCGTLGGMMPGKDKAEKPAELAEIEAVVRLEPLWKKSTGDIENGNRFIQPILAGNILYTVSSTGDVTAIDATEGATIWSVDVDARISAGIGFGDGLVFVGTYDGDVIALQAGDGKQAWQASVSGEVLASPMGANGTVVVPASVDDLFGLATSDGSEKWTVSESTPRLSLRGRSRPMVRSDLVLAGFDDGKLALIRLDNGQLVWDVRVGDAVGKSELERMADVDAMPLLVNDIVYTAAFQSGVAAIHAPTSQRVWENKASTFHDMAIDSRNLYVTDDNDVVIAIDRRSGITVWRQDGFQRRGLSAPAVIGNHVLVGDREGYLHLLNTSDGRAEGRAKAGSAVLAQPVVDGLVAYVQTAGGDTAAWQLSY